MSLSDHLDSVCVGAVAGVCVATPIMAAIVPERGGLTLIELHFGIAALAGMAKGAAHLFGQPEKLKKATMGLAFAVAASTMFSFAPTEKRLQLQEQEMRKHPPYVPYPKSNG